jgi:hypothetical protein
MIFSNIHRFDNFVALTVSLTPVKQALRVLLKSMNNFSLVSSTAVCDAFTALGLGCFTNVNDTGIAILPPVSMTPLSFDFEVSIKLTEPSVWNLSVIKPVRYRTYLLLDPSENKTFWCPCLPSEPRRRQACAQERLLSHPAGVFAPPGTTSPSQPPQNRYPRRQHSPPTRLDL